MKVSFFSLLAIVFIALKLSGHITWSWWWVLSPIWGAWLAVIVIGLVVVSLDALTK